MSSDGCHAIEKLESKVVDDFSNMVADESSVTRNKGFVSDNSHENLISESSNSESGGKD